MRRYLWYAFALLVLAVPAFAQSGETIRDRADMIVRQYNPNVGSLTTWRYDGYTMTNDGSLGCNLVAPYNLGYSVTPWRVQLSYSNGQTYVVYVSSDPNVSVACDSKLGVSSSPPSVIISDTGRCTASAFPGSPAALYSRPDANTALNYRFSNANVAVIGRSANTNWYQLNLGNNVTPWVIVNTVTLNGSGCQALPVVAEGARDVNFTTPITTPPTTGGIGGAGINCFANAVYANVRQAPNLGAPIVDVIQTGETYGVVSVLSGDTWREVYAAGGTGWVSSSVSYLTGSECGQAPIIQASGNNTVYTQNTSNTTSGCPYGYAGYLTPRLSVGGTGQVADSTLVNLRTSPTAGNTPILTELGGGTQFSVIGGPNCGEGGVIWWYIEANGLYGWIAESETGSANAYYAMPTVQTVGLRFDTEGTVAELGRVQTAGSTLGIAFTGDGSRFAAANGIDSLVRVWDSTTGNTITQQFVHDFNARVSFVAYAPDGEQALTADLDHTVNIWNGNDLTASVTADMQPFFTGDVAVAPDWSQFAVSGCLEGSLGETGCTLGGVQIYDLAGNVVAQYDGQAGTVAALAYTDGLLASAATDNTVWLWDTAEGAVVAEVETDGNFLFDVAFSPEGNTLAIGTDAGVSLYDVASGEITETISEPDGGAFSLAYSPDGALLAIGSTRDNVLVWDVPGNKPLETYGGYTNGVTSLSFSPDSTLLAIGDNGGEVALVNLGVE